VESILKQIIGEKEAKTYLTALELGTPTISRLATKTGIPRSTTYLVLEDLEKMGLTTRSQKDGNTQVVPARPKQVEQILSNQIEELTTRRSKLQKIIPDLQALHRKSGKKPKVQYFEGLANTRKLLLDMIDESKDSQYLNLCQGYSQKHAGLLADPEYLQESINKVKQYDIQAREIIENMKSAREYKDKMKDTNVEILLAPQIKNPKTTHIDKYIWQNKVAILNSEIDYAVLIEDKFIAENERISFNVLWNALKNGTYQY
jgi:sugar-specific transcriptional regulator TrmB